MKQMITWLTVILIIGGCSDFLRKQPLAEVSESSAFTSTAGAQKALTATYHMFVGNYTQRLYQNGTFDIVTDNARKGGEGPNDVASIRQFGYYTLNSTNGVADQIWQFCYRGIYLANRVIKNVPDIDMDQNQKKYIVAQAKFLRGYFYSILVMLYGDVPLITNPKVKSSDLVRTPKDQVFKRIHQDFQDASEVLPPKSQLSSNERGRATKGAAEAYNGKVYLFQHNFREAEKWFKKVIDSKEYYLDPNFAHIFDLEGDFGPGHIFEINHVYSPQYPGLGNRGSIVKGSAGMYGYGFLDPTQDLVDAFEPNDPRLAETVFKNGDVMPDGKIGDVGNSETDYMSMKYYLKKSDFPPSGDPAESGVNDLLMRYGEVLLWYAEAANENGHAQPALKALNEVRKRARQGNPNVLPDVTVTNKNKLRKKIWHEERVEYALEDQRFFDLVRTGRAAKVLHAFAEKYHTAKGANFQKGVNNHLPIPQTEIDLSHGKLKQNPGYK
jgi:tetratricopeptide (TPR) repeat protein